MMNKIPRYLFSGLFLLLGSALLLLTVRLSFTKLDSSPILVKAPDSAMQQVLTLMDAVCASDFTTAGNCLYGTPELRTDLEGDTARLLWSAYADSLEYTVKRGCYASDSGLAVDLELRTLDLDSITGRLHDRCQAMLDQAAKNTENPNFIYESTNQYRQEVVLDIFRQALELALQEDASYCSTPLTLHLTYDYENDCWWILPEDPLLRCISGNL